MCVYHVSNNCGRDDLFAISRLAFAIALFAAIEHFGLGFTLMLSYRTLDSPDMAAKAFGEMRLTVPSSGTR